MFEKLEEIEEVVKRIYVKIELILFLELVMKMQM